MIKVLVTGANGFIGQNLCPFLKEKGYFIRGAVRSNVRDVPGVDEFVQVGAIDGETDWQEALLGINTVIHLAARVHVMDSRFRPSTRYARSGLCGNDMGGNDELCAFRRVNVIGIERLARMAVKAGVRRFVFASSVKVNGEGRELHYTEEDVPKPEDAYGISKMEAE